MINNYKVGGKRDTCSTAKKKSSSLDLPISSLENEILCLYNIFYKYRWLGLAKLSLHALWTVRFGL